MVNRRFWLCLILPVVLAPFLGGCKDDKAVQKVYRNKFRITNTGSVTIRKLTISCQDKAIVATNVEPWKPIVRELVHNGMPTIGFTIEYADGSIVRHPSEEWSMHHNDLIQAVIEEKGKIHFR